jgi:hypothetical protein
MLRPADAVPNDKIEVGGHDTSWMVTNVKRSFGLPDLEEGGSDHQRWLVTARAARCGPETR